MGRYRVNQHLIVLNLGSVSISKGLVTEFITVKVSQKRNLMQNMTFFFWHSEISNFLGASFQNTLSECPGEMLSGGFPGQ